MFVSHRSNFSTVFTDRSIGHAKLSDTYNITNRQLEKCQYQKTEKKYRLHLKKLSNFKEKKIYALKALRISKKLIDHCFLIKSTQFDKTGSISKLDQKVKFYSAEKFKQYFLFSKLEVVHIFRNLYTLAFRRSWPSC